MTRRGPARRGTTRSAGIRLVATAAAACGLAGALAGCGGSGGPAGAGATTSALHDVPTGAQLVRSLLTSSSLPAGFTEDAGGLASSGAALSAAAPTVNLATASCSTILNTLGQPGFGEASYADDSFTPASALGEFDEILLEFHGGGAAAFISQLRTALGRCGSFDASDETGGVEAAKLILGTPPALGTSALSFSVWVKIGTAQMVLTDVAAQRGTAVVFVDNSTLASSPDAVNLTTLAGALLGRLPGTP
jgi:hypothetical protein